MDKNPSRDRFFIYPQVQKQNEIHTLITSMDTFLESLSKTDRHLVGVLLAYAAAHSAQSHLLPQLTPVEFMLLAIVIEQQRELSNQKKTPPEPVPEFTHPPFP